MRSMLVVLPCVVAALCGCGTPGPRPEAVPLDERQLSAFLARGRDPRIFGLTVYPAEGGPLLANANRLYSGQMAELPFSVRDCPLPVVTITSRLGKKSLALLDPSSRKSWIDIQLSEDFSLTALGPPHYQARPNHVLSEMDGFLCVADKLVFDELTMGNAVLYARAATGSMWPLTRDARCDKVRTVIGFGMLKAFAYVRIDFTNRRVMLSADRDYKVREDALMASVPFTSVDGALAVNGRVNGEEQRLLLDPAGPYALSAPDVPGGIVRQVRIGDLVWRNVAATVPTELDPPLAAGLRLGNELLSPYVMVIDNRKGQIHFERPPL